MSDVKNRRLRLPDDVRGHLVDHARGGAPAEVCGVLGGQEEPERVVTSVHAVTNVAETPRSRYELDPAETVRVIDALEDAGRDVVGFYHSHPAGPDGPSATDEERATWRDKVYCIVSLDGETGEDGDADATIGAWRWTGEAFEPVRIEP
ncbi:desampylase [Haloarchaeobius sp. DT45]|uniref:desampylase n=1 Tax=Haloarchaeobius sp. DT45 TaxID=3446116 RepID=UPI003F6BF97A